MGAPEGKLGSKQNHKNPPPFPGRGSPRFPPPPPGRRGAQAPPPPTHSAPPPNPCPPPPRTVPAPPANPVARVAQRARGALAGLRSPRPSHHVTADGSMRVIATMTVRRPADELYRLWRDFARLPEFMTHLQSVEPL